MPVGFEGESFMDATVESRRLMRSGYGVPEPAPEVAEAAGERLVRHQQLRELAAADDERSGVTSRRSAAANMAAGYARNDAIRAGADVDVEPDPAPADPEENS